MNSAQQNVFEQLGNIVLIQPNSSPRLVAINGKDASGKTIFANNFADYLKSLTDREIIRISGDDFMNERAVRRTPSSSQGETCYRYSFNEEMLKKYVLIPLQPGQNLTYKTKIFDYDTDKPIKTETRQSSKDSIVIVDGVFFFKDSLVKFWTLKILLEVDDEMAIERGSRRDLKRIGNYELARSLYVDRYMASQIIYYKNDHPLERADIVISNNDFENPKIIKNRYHAP